MLKIQLVTKRKKTIKNQEDLEKLRKLKKNKKSWQRKRQKLVQTYKIKKKTQIK